MPRLDHTVPVEKRLSAPERALVQLMRELVNTVRTQVGLEPLSEHALAEQFRYLLRQEEAAARALAHPGGGT
jgi:hypothetical protein